MPEDEVREEPAQPRPRDHEARLCGGRGAERADDARDGEDGPPAQVRDRDPRRGDEARALDALRVLDLQLGGHEAAHRVADDDARAELELLAERVDLARVVRDRDLLARHLGVAEPGQVHRDAAPLLREVGQVLEPVLPAAGEAVDEDDRRPVAGADVHVVHPLALDLGPL